jgi:hypothetical protein
MRDKIVVVMIHLPPWCAAIEADWFPPTAESDGRVRPVRIGLSAISNMTRLLSLLGSAVFVGLFLVFPLVTATWGLGYAVIGAIITHFLLLILLILLLSSSRGEWRLSWSQVAGQIFECAVCPGYFANIGRRLPLRYGIVGGDSMSYSYAIGRRTSPTTLFQLGLMLEQVETSEDLTENERVYVKRFRRLLVRGRDE